MFKTLAGRALFPVGIAVTGFVIVCFLLLYSMIKNVINRDAVVHTTNVSDTILKSTRYAMLKSDRELLTTIIRNIGEQQGVEHIRICNKKGLVNISTRMDEVNRQIDKKAEGCIICHSAETPITTLGKMEQARFYKNSAGKSVIAITTPIYNEPECSTTACHFHPQGQKVLGIIDIGFSREVQLNSLASIRNQMITFSLMVLILTVGGVTAILRRSVFLPMQKLQRFTEEVENGDGKHTAPPQGFPDELDRIAQSYYKLSLKSGRTHGEANPESTKEADRQGDR